jgi:outer membrane receptor protein involved in Fe transport
VNVLLPGIGVDYRFNKFFSSFIGYHKGFAPPGTKEGTKPESSDNFELGTRYRKGNTNLQAVVFYNAYQNEYPLKEGAEYRRPIYLLYHVMNHLNLFGTGYLGQVRSTLNSVQRF